MDLILPPPSLRDTSPIFGENGGGQGGGYLISYVTLTLAVIVIWPGSIGTLA